VATAGVKGSRTANTAEVDELSETLGLHHTHGSQVCSGLKSGESGDHT